jgi:hypothetical protein
MMDLSRAKLIDLMEPCFTGHRYLMGAKPQLGSAPDSWVSSDCSGFTRWLAFGAWGITEPQGSVQQHDWCRDSKCLKSANYDTAGALMDSVVRQCFIVPTANEPGHTLFVVNGMTIESCGGHGPCRQKWSVYKGRINACYELGSLV